MNNRYILTGPPGSGKSTILKELSKLHYPIVEEPARAILSEQRSVDGDGVSERNPFLLKELILSRMLGDYLRHPESQVTFFDRGIPDAIAYSQCFGLDIGAELNASHSYRYNNKVFYAPAWRDIFVNDDERTLSFEEAEAFGDNLKAIYQQFDYQLIELPLLPVKDRVRLIIDSIEG